MDEVILPEKGTDKNDSPITQTNENNQEASEERNNQEPIKEIPEKTELKNSKLNNEPIQEEEEMENKITSKISSEESQSESEEIENISVIAPSNVIEDKEVPLGEIESPPPIVPSKSPKIQIK